MTRDGAQDVDDGEEVIGRVRPIDDVIEAMRMLMQACARGMDETRTAEVFHEALSLTLEIRVPRMPDTDEELADMLRGHPDDGPHVTSEEAFARMADHGRRFSRFLGEYRGRIDRRNWDTVAEMLLPRDGVEGRTWPGGPYATGVGEGYARMTNGTRALTVKGATAATAILAVVMAAHIEWRDIWRR